jgi:hypothetical protein
LSPAAIPGVDGVPDGGGEGHGVLLVVLGDLVVFHPWWVRLQYKKGGEASDVDGVSTYHELPLSHRGMCMRALDFSRWRGFKMGTQALTYLAHDLEGVRLGLVRVVVKPRPLHATVVCFVVLALVGLLVLGDLRVSFGGA